MQNPPFSWGSTTSATWTTAVLAQQPAGGGISVQSSTTKSYVVDTVLVVALFGAALFAVCRASRRM